MSVLLILFLIGLFGYYIDNQNAAVLTNSLEVNRALCFRATYMETKSARAGSRFFYNIGNNGKLVKYVPCALPSETIKFVWVPSRFIKKEFFVLRADSNAAVLPIWTWKSYELLKKYFPDSAKLVDTTLFY